MSTTPMATPASTSITGTDVSASVSLFALVLGLCPLLLVVLISLALSGLTGLLSLVGLTTRLAASAVQGD
jgi:hypothetical protein